MSRVPNVNLKCESCGLEVLDKADHPTWKGVPMAPNSAELKWYCREKEPCEEAFNAAVKEAESAWSRGQDGQVENSRGGDGS